jgi:hypothetical protein
MREPDEPMDEYDEFIASGGTVEELAEALGIDIVDEVDEVG